MKASQLIKQLQYLIDEHGDLEVEVFDDSVGWLELEPPCYHKNDAGIETFFITGD